MILFLALAFLLLGGIGGWAIGGWYVEKTLHETIERMKRDLK